MDGEGWWAAVHGVEKSRSRLRDFHFSLSCTGEGNGSPVQRSCPGMAEPGGLLSMGSHSRTQLKRLSSSSSNKSHVRKKKLWWGSPRDSVVKNLPYNAGDISSLPGPGRFHTLQSN